MRKQQQSELTMEFKEGLCGDPRWVATAKGLPIYVEGRSTNEAILKFEAKLREYFNIFGVQIKIVT